MPFADDLMLAYKEYDNAQAVEIVLTGRASTEEFDKIARKLETFIKRHRQIRVLKIPTCIIFGRALLRPSCAATSGISLPERWKRHATG
jgi:hypothetical protein